MRWDGMRWDEMRCKIYRKTERERDGSVEKKNVGR
jgi:hypothetical protein